MKGALINGLTLNTLFFGAEFAIGTMKALFADTTSKAIPASGAYTITVTAPNGGRFVDDAGVMGAGGAAMIKVAPIRSAASILLQRREFTRLTRRIRARRFTRALPTPPRCRLRRKSS